MSHWRVRYPERPLGRIAFRDGQSGTVEAKGHAFGVVADTVYGRRWDTSVLIPGSHYDTAVPLIDLVRPTKIYFIDGERLQPPPLLAHRQVALAHIVSPELLDLARRVRVDDLVIDRQAQKLRQDFKPAVDR